MSHAEKPAFFFAFANDRGEGGAYLRNLAEEERGVRAALFEADRAGRCEVLPVEHNATLDCIFDVFPRYPDRIAVFHFGGHAGGGELLLETAAGGRSVAHAAGLADFLGAQGKRGLQLVFLNGCSTEPQVDRLLSAGVPAVIATSQAIDDAVATEFANRFYLGLAGHRSLREAFDEAEAVERARKGRPEDAYHRSLVPRIDEKLDWPWKIHLKDETTAGWALPRARRLAGSAERVEPQPILPYLCDRSPQEARLGSGVSEHLRERPSRPLVVLVHGHFREAHDKFVERLRVDLLPPLLGLDDGAGPILHKGPGFFTDPRMGEIEDRCGVLHRELAELLCGDPHAECDELVSAVVENRCPVLVDLAVNVNRQSPLPAAKVLLAWLEGLAEWADLPPEQPFIVVLRLSWKEEKGKSWFRRFKRSAGARVARLVEELEEAPLGGRLGVVALPPLERIGEDDVLGWIEKHALPVLRQVHGAASTMLDEDLRERVRELFERTPRLPMDKVGPKLRHHLRECLNQGGP